MKDGAPTFVVWTERARTRVGHPAGGKDDDGVFVDGTINTDSYKAQVGSDGNVHLGFGYSSDDDSGGNGSNGSYTLSANSGSMNLGEINEISPFSQALIQQTAKDSAGFPDICSGGAFVYAGVQAKFGKGEHPAHAFGGYLGNYDSKEGWSNNGLVEGSKGNASGGGAAGSKGAEGLVFIPFAEAGGGLVGVSRNGLSVGGYAGTPEKFPVGAGAGAYFNITSMGACHHP